MEEFKSKKITRELSFENKKRKIILSLELQNIDSEDEKKINDFLEVMFREIVLENSII